jgi:putative DNA primase/helicase
MTAAAIAEALGGAYRSGKWWRSRCPVHGSRGGTLALREGDRGLVVHCHAGCGRSEILTELRRRGLIGGCAEIRPGALGRQRNTSRANDLRRAAEESDRQRRIAAAMDIWTESYRADSTIVERYLRSRGITMPLPPTLRLNGMHGPYGRHPSGGRRPQMVGLIEHIEHGPVGVTCTFLAIDGSSKATLDPVRMFHGPVGGGAVRLGTVRPDTWLAIGEGIETTLSVMQATGLPGWAALSAVGIERLILPSAAPRVLICADHDANGVGERAARAAAERWLTEGRHVQLAMPPEPGSDFNDLLLGRGA